VAWAWEFGFEQSLLGNKHLQQQAYPSRFERAKHISLLFPSRLISRRPVYPEAGQAYAQLSITAPSLLLALSISGLLSKSEMHITEK
jgi:hypothetical protein